MNNTYQIYLISDSTGETLERIFLALKAQFKNIEYKIFTSKFDEIAKAENLEKEEAPLELNEEASENAK